MTGRWFPTRKQAIKLAPCLRCGAQVGERCVTMTGWAEPTSPHQARLLAARGVAAGIARPAERPDEHHGQPVVWPTAIVPGRTTRTVHVLCPWCGRRHNHGWPYGTPTIGARVAHCVGGARGSYLIITPANEGMTK